MPMVMHTPRSVDLAITGNCNLRCRYCSHFSGAGDVHSNVPIEEWLLFFKELKENAVMRVTLQGGEPFFHNEIQRIISGLIENRMRFSILSNGTLITDTIASFLIATSHCDYVQISIDGSRPEIHDAFRGHGTFEKAVAGLKILQKYRVPVTVRATVHRKNIHDLEALARFLLEDLNLSSFSTNSASFMGLCRQNQDQIQLSIDERTQVMHSLFRLYRQYPGRITASAGPLADTLRWSKMEESRLKNPHPVPPVGHLSACGGVFNNLAVRADGVLVPCVQLSQIELGKINHDNLKEVWQNHRELIRLRNRHHIPLDAFPFCRGCVYIPHCTGNCPALAYTILGRDDQPSPDACLKRFLEEGGMLPAFDGGINVLE